MKRLVLVLVSTMTACGDVAAQQRPGDVVSDEGALSGTLPVDAFLSGLAGSWYGEVKNVVGIGEAPRIVHEATYGTACNILVRETRYKAPPRSHL